MGWHFFFIFLLLPVVFFFPGIAIQLLSLVPYWSVTIANTISPIADKIFFAELKGINPQLEEELGKLASAERDSKWFSSLWNDLKSSWYFTKYSLILLILSAIPWAGGVLAFCGQNILVADRLGWTLFAVFTVNCRSMKFAQQRKWIAPRRLIILGFCLPFALCLSIPVLGPAIIPFSQAASAHLFDHIYSEELYKTEEE